MKEVTNTQKSNYISPQIDTYINYGIDVICVSENGGEWNWNLEDEGL